MLYTSMNIDTGSPKIIQVIFRIFHAQWGLAEDFSVVKREIFTLIH